MKNKKTFKTNNRGGDPLSKETAQTKPTSCHGITLIALVITIIVMLILAGVAISLTVNQENLFGKANEAVTEWNKRVEEEQIEIDKALGYLGIEAGVEITTKLPEGWENSKVKEIVKQGSLRTPIPVGYTASSVPGENSITGGLVIYEGTDAVTEANHAIALTSRNQYVWISVEDINDMIMCKSNTASSVCDLVLDGNTLKCTAHNSEDLCGRLYGVDATSTTKDGKKIYQTAMNFTDRSQTYTVNSGYRELDLVTDFDYDNSSYLTTAGIADGKASTLLSQMENDFKEMATSVAKYGGYYIARYEAGENGASKKNQNVLTSVDDVKNASTYDGGNPETVLAGNMWYRII